MLKRTLSILGLALTFMACGGSNAESQKTVDSLNSKTDSTMTATTDKEVEIKTTMGDITVKLYGDTPQHQANFLKLVKDGTYNGTLFHRVIDQFMVQAGDPDSKTAKPGQQLGSGDMGYTIPAEIVYPKHYHKRGALAAARTGDNVDPERRSSGSQFYIVTGKKATEQEVRQMAAQSGQNMQAMQAEFNKLVQQHMAEIQQMQANNDRAGLQKLQEQLVAQVEAKFGDAKAPEIPEQLIKDYTTVGGTPFLDQQCTVFGEVVKGMDVVEKIEKAQTDSNDRPTQDIKIISMKVLN